MLLPDSTITPHNGAAATGPSEPLSGSFSWRQHIPSDIVDSFAFDITSLHFKSSSYSLKLNNSPQPDNITKIGPDGGTQLNANVNWSRVPQGAYFLGGFEDGTYVGLADAPSELRLTDGLGSSSGGNWLAYLTIHALASPLGSLLSDFKMNGNGLDALGNSPSMEISGVCFSAGALQLTNTDGFVATAKVPDLSYASFTVAVDFNPCDFAYPHSTILSCGPNYRWLGLENDASGHLQITLNNTSYVFPFTNVISANRWHTLICSVDLASQRIVTFLDGEHLPDITLSGFQFEVVGTDSEESDKAFSFRNNGNATRLYGYADNLRIYSRALTQEQISWMYSNPAQDRYNVRVEASCISTNKFGSLVSTLVQNRDIVRHCAEAAGITNPAGLVLVYDRSADALQVVNRTNGLLICTPISFAGDVSVTNGTRTVRQRLALTLSEVNRAVNGTINATETNGHDSEGKETNFRLSGTLRFATEADTSNGAKIYSGVLCTAAKFTTLSH
ncbi:MAG: LamG-like jellyroll fold domain-containing protein [Limisphaerales bacterium]